MQEILMELQQLLSQFAADTTEEDIVDEGDHYSLTITAVIGKDELGE